jgi:hypothetical protein
LAPISDNENQLGSDCNGNEKSTTVDMPNRYLSYGRLGTEIYPGTSESAISMQISRRFWNKAALIIIE